MIKKIGKFNTESDILRITDPCYDKTVWCSGILQNCNIGKWTSFIKYSDEKKFGNRVSENIAIFGDESIENVLDIINNNSWKDSGIDVGVDSGQCGIFDDSKYPKTKDEIGEWGDKSSFYGNCCDITDTNELGGNLVFGVVSRTGFGDGSYVCLYSTKDDKINAVRIIFIQEDEEEDDDFIEEDIIEDYIPEGFNPDDITFLKI